MSFLETIFYSAPSTHNCTNDNQLSLNLLRKICPLVDMKRQTNKSRRHVRHLRKLEIEIGALDVSNQLDPDIRLDV